MTNRKKALIVGTKTAVSIYESGASIRLEYLRTLLKSSDFSITTINKKDARIELKKDWDLIILISFSTAKLLRKSRKKTKNLWFDPTDSWTLTRFSLFRGGDFKQLALLARDLFWIWGAPKIDLVTFITRRDLNQEKKWLSRSARNAVLPVNALERDIVFSQEVRLVFVGDGKYAPNVRAIDFLEKVLKNLPSNYYINVYGKDFESSNSRFVFHGYSNQNELYQSKDIHLAPIEFGAGLKLKVAIPLWNGLQVISTPEGGIGFNKVTNLHLVSTPEQFSRIIDRQVLQISQSVLSSTQYEQIFCDDETYKVVEWIDSI